MPRPSGTVQMPRRARPSAESVVTASPSKYTSPALGVERAGADVQHGRLAAPVRPQEGHHGTGRDGQVHAVHDLDRSVSGPDVTELEDGGFGVHGVPR